MLMMMIMIIVKKTHNNSMYDDSNQLYVPFSDGIDTYFVVFNCSSTIC